MAGEETRDKAKQLQQAYLANLSLKLREGKSLTEREFEHLRLLAGGGEGMQGELVPLPGQFPKTPLKGKDSSSDAGEESDEEEVGVPERLRFKRSYTLTERALDARKKNAKQSTGPKTEKGKKASCQNSWKHGRYAKSFIMHRIKPCKSTCPHYPCQLVEDNTTQPGGQCLDKAAVVEFYSAICEAAINKKYDDFNHLAALTIAEQMNVIHLLMEDIQRDGTILKKEKHDKEGGYLGYEVVPHPSLLSLAKLIDSLSLTPNEMMITPKALLKKEDDDEGIKSLADLMSNVVRNMQQRNEKKPAN